MIFIDEKNIRQNKVDFTTRLLSKTQNILLEIQKRFLNMQNFEISAKGTILCCPATLKTNYVISEALDKSTTSACAEKPLHLVESEVRNVPFVP